MERADVDVESAVQIPVDRVAVDGTLGVPEGARAVIVFAHGSGSSRHSSRNRAVARALRVGGFATLLLDLLTPREDAVDEMTREHRFDIGLLATRVVAATDWLRAQARTKGLPVGYFGASTGAAAALVAGAERPEAVFAIVSRGGRPDLAGRALREVRAPTLLIVGSLDDVVIELNQEAMAQMVAAEVKLEIVPGATHLFEERGALEHVARLAAAWFAGHAGDAV